MALFGKVGEGFLSGLTKAATSLVGPMDETAEKEEERNFEAEFGLLWEKSENCVTCRGCDVQFTVVERKHHCRTCAGVYCNSCCPFDDKNIRTCLGCKRGEIPGEALRKVIRSKIEGEEARLKTSNGKKPTKKGFSARKQQQDVCDNEDDDHALKEITQGIEKAFVRGGDFLGVGMPTGFLRSKNLKLIRGSAFNEDGYAASSSGRSKSIPLAGYFEFRNKSSECVCIKVIERESEGPDVKYEAVRPIFICVPPSESIHAIFDQEKDMLELIVLFNNPNSIPSHASLVYDTQARGVTPDVITPCAKVSLFKSCCMFSIESKSKNVLLKYKGAGRVETRMGNSIGRVGLLSRLQGKRFAASKIDYSTNVDSINLIKKLDS